jgi:hypothetical protein
LAGIPGKRAGGQVIVDIDATLVTAHSDKEGAEPTYKRGFGFAPMCTFVDHGQHGTGESLAIDLRPGKASPWNSADHLNTLDAALVQLPEQERSQVLVRADTGACSRCSCTTSPIRGWSTPSGSRPKTPSRQRSRRSRSRRGGRHLMATVGLAMGRRSPSSPRGCGPGHPEPGLTPGPEGLAGRDAGYRSP